MPNLSRLQRQALDSFQQGDLDTAERLCADILGRRPEDFDALHLFGMLHLERRNAVEALRYLSAALKSNAGSSGCDVESGSGAARQRTF